MYVCEAQRNSDVKYNHYVIVLVLSAPANVKPGVVTSTSIEVTWDRSDDATGYYISCTTTALHGSDKYASVNSGDTTNCTLCNLMKNTPYLITVQSLNTDNKKGDQSDEVSIRTSKWYITIANSITMDRAAL